MKVNKIKTGIVVVNYNDYKTTINFINNIKDYKNVDLIVIVDNFSTNDSYNQLKKYENSLIKVIKSEKNGGYGYGNNIGIKYIINCLGRCNIVISNPDIEIKERDLTELLHGLNSNKNYAIISPIIIEKGKENKGWKLPTVFDDILLNLVFVNRFLRKKLLFYKPNYYNKKYIRVDCVSGCFFIVKSDIIDKINYFDESLFLYYEENVIGKKIKEINKTIVVDTDVKILHHHSVSIDSSITSINKYKILKKSQMYYHTKYNKSNLIEKLLLYSTNKLTLFFLYIYYIFKYRR